MFETPWSPTSSFWDSPVPVVVKNLPELLEDHWTGSAPTSKSSGSSSIFKFLSSAGSKSSVVTSCSPPSSLAFRGVLCQPASQVLGDKNVVSARSPPASSTAPATRSPSVSTELETKPVDIPGKSGVLNEPGQGLLSKNLQPPVQACRNSLRAAETAADGALGSWANRKAVYPLMANVQTKATSKDVKEPSPDSTLDRSDSRKISGNQLEVLSPNVLGGEFVPAKKPKRTHVDKTLGDAAWRYRFRRKWAREQLNYYRGKMSPPTPPKPLEGRPDEVASALVGWMDDVHAFSPSALPNQAQPRQEPLNFLPMEMMAY